VLLTGNSGPVSLLRLAVRRVLVAMVIGAKSGAASEPIPAEARPAVHCVSSVDERSCQQCEIWWLGNRLISRPLRIGCST
jgi:hypothetical protein